MLHAGMTTDILNPIHAQMLVEACFAVQDKFFTQLKNSADGFNVIAEFFGTGLLNASTASTQAAEL